MIAHRGFSGRHPENTLAAIEAAWAAGAASVEVDVRHARDGELVLFHDARIEKSGEAVADLTLDQLRARTGIAVPKLADAVRDLPEGRCLLLDLKDAGEAFVDQVVKETRALKPNQVAYQSPSRDVLRQIGALRPDAPRIYLSSLEYQGRARTPPDAAGVVAGLADLGVVAISVKGRKFIDRAYVQALRAPGLRVFVWTINPEDRLRHYLGLGVDGIITDWPDRLVALKADGGKSP